MLSYKLFFVLTVGSPSLGGPLPLYKAQIPEATSRPVAKDPESIAISMQTLDSAPSTGSTESGGHLLLPTSQFPVNRDRGQAKSSNSTENIDSATSSSSIGSGGSGEFLLPPSSPASAPNHMAPAKSPQLLYAQLNVKQTQVQLKSSAVCSDRAPRQTVMHYILP